MLRPEEGAVLFALGMPTVRGGNWPAEEEPGVRDRAWSSCLGPRGGGSPRGAAASWSCLVGPALPRARTGDAFPASSLCPPPAPTAGAAPPGSSSAAVHLLHGVQANLRAGRAVPFGYEGGHRRLRSVLVPSMAQHRSGLMGGRQVVLLAGEPLDGHRGASVSTGVLCRPGPPGTPSAMGAAWLYRLASRRRHSWRRRKRP